jgi:CheY-like chemotaxis protein
MKILLVEDSKFIRLSMERALSRAGYAVNCACDGEEAIALAHEWIPDLILLDMLLPKVTGLEVLKALKHDEKTSAIPVVVLSALSRKNEERLQADGAFAFLEKSALRLERDAGGLLSALGQIVKKLPQGEA